MFEKPFDSDVLGRKVNVSANVSLSVGGDELTERIEVNPRMLGGKPLFRGTGIPVYLILGVLSAGYDFRRIVEAYPTLSEEDITAVAGA